METTSKLLIIDTNQYAGNFEREMTAFITGAIGECEVGEEEAEIARVEISKKTLNWLDENIDQDFDEHGCQRPCVLWQNAEGEYNSVAILFGEFPTGIVLEVIKLRALDYCHRYPDYNISILKIRLVEPKYQLVDVGVVYP